MNNSLLSFCRTDKQKVKMVAKYYLIIFLFFKSGLLYSGPTINGKITTTNSIPVQKAKISFISTADTSKYFSSLTDTLGNYIITITSVGSKNKEISDFQIYQNYPNPFSERTTIAYQTKQQLPVEISIYNILGQKVKTFRQKFSGQNIGQVQWDGRDGLGKKVATGIYFYVVNTGGKKQVKKMLYIENLIAGGIGTQVFNNNSYNYIEDLYQDSSNIYTVYIENTDSTEPIIETMEIENVVVQGDTVLDFHVNEAKVPQWPMARYDAGGRGHQFGYPYPEGLEDTAVEVLWIRKFLSGRVANISIGREGNVYVGVTRSDTILYAFSENGNLLWSVSGVGIARRGVPITIKDDGTIILSANTFGGAFTAAYTPQGNQIWKIDTGSTYSLPAISKDGIIYFCTYISPIWGELIALKTTTGEILWKKEGAYISCSPSIDNDGMIYYSSIQDRALIALSPDGTEKWRYSDSTGFTFESIVIDADGNLYFYNAETFGLYCLNKKGELLWTGKGGGNYALDSPAITPDGNIVSASMLTVWLYRHNGELIWQLKPPFEIRSHPIVDKKGRIYLGSEGSDVSADFYRITESGEIDVQFNGTSTEIIGDIWWLVLSNNERLYYYGHHEIVCVK